MGSNHDFTTQDIHTFVKNQEEKELLRFITCGSVDDGKSTLIGRLLWDSKLIFEDQLAALEIDSKIVGTQGENIDYALLLDGLQAEREQGITIDVAYRFFATDKRKFIVADTPGHEQYTRNMVTGASTAKAAIILIDARKGILTQTKRHSYIVSLMGIRHIILAINKMDLIDYSEVKFNSIKNDYLDFAVDLDFDETTCIPISAINGDNIVVKSDHTDWYTGPTLMDSLETINVSDGLSNKPFRMPVQWVNRPDPNFRGYSGTIASGRIRPGEHVVIPSSGQKSCVERIVTLDGDLSEAVAGQAVTLTLTDEIDISRGDILTDPQHSPAHTDQFKAHIVWMHEKVMLPGRRYLIKTAATTTQAHITKLKHKVNINTCQLEPGKTLKLNEVGVCNVSVGKPISFDPYTENRTTGSFILIDRFTNATVGAGMIDFPLRRASNIHWQSLDVDKNRRAELMGQKPMVLWFTGLSGSGKSTIANRVEKKLHSLGKHTYTLDGDNVRHGLNRDLGFTNADRVENIRRIAETAKLFVDAGIIVLVSFISPFKSERLMARDLLEEGEFVEIYVNTPLEICEKRDPKGLYKKARSGELKNFTGIDSDYETPENPDIVVNGSNSSPEKLAEMIFLKLWGENA